ncbi:hypothetical protein BN1723_007525 [Verticillium longisporum]|uniref:Fungal STAND N-terminal Goodbye domain-containing protein n=1 Tax=Verticillium longisporum TaxID=100787 RepID=A0A0G4NLX7_VERLO|nr:hypothetical protein BN1723_007525 [Verticillium longisporum]
MTEKSDMKDLRRTDSGMQRQFAAIIHDAQKMYAESSDQDLSDYMNPPMTSVEDMLAVIARQNKQFESFRAKRQRIFSALSAALMPIEVVGESLAGAASEVFAPSQNIFAAVMYLVNAAKDVSACYDSIIELFEKMQDFTSRLRFYVSQHLSPELRDKLVTILVTVFEIFVLATAEVRRGRLKAYFKLDPWIVKLEELQAQQSKHQNRNVPLHMAGFDVNEASIFLVLFYRFRDRPDEARELAASLVADHLDILEDDEPQNDEIGIRNLQRTLIAAGDLGDARALWQSTRTPVNPATVSSNLMTERRVRSPRLGVSPKRGRASELSLGKVFSPTGNFTPGLSCDYCLRRFDSKEEYVVCVYCIDTLFCLPCLENVIKQRSFSPGHTSACGPNHSFMNVPPLLKELLPGEIMVDGQLQRFSDWKKALRQTFRSARARRSEGSPRGLGIL